MRYRIESWRNSILNKVKPLTLENEQYMMEASQLSYMDFESTGENFLQENSLKGNQFEEESMSERSFEEDGSKGNQSEEESMPERMSQEDSLSAVDRFVAVAKEIIDQGNLAPCSIIFTKDNKLLAGILFSGITDEIILEEIYYRNQKYAECIPAMFRYIMEQMEEKEGNSIISVISVSEDEKKQHLRELFEKIWQGADEVKDDLFEYLPFEEEAYECMPRLNGLLDYILERSQWIDTLEGSPQETESLEGSPQETDIVKMTEAELLLDADGYPFLLISLEDTNQYILYYEKEEEEYLLTSRLVAVDEDGIPDLILKEEVLKEGLIPDYEVVWEMLF